MELVRQMSKGLRPGSYYLSFQSDQQGSVTPEHREYRAIGVGEVVGGSHAGETNSDAGEGETNYSQTNHGTYSSDQPFVVIEFVPWTGAPGYYLFQMLLARAVDEEGNLIHAPLSDLELLKTVSESATFPEDLILGLTRETYLSLLHSTVFDERVTCTSCGGSFHATDPHNGAPYC